MITEIVYHTCKIYFMLLGIYYIYTLLFGDIDIFTHITGLFGIAFLISNIMWYFFKGGK